MSPSLVVPLSELDLDGPDGVQETGADKLNGSRIVFGSGEPGGHWLLPEVIRIGWSRFRQAAPGALQRHRHGGAFEICLILDGEVEWEASGRTYILRPGDIYITQPGEVHGGVDTAMHPCTLYWLNVGAPSLGYCWPGCSDEEMRSIEEGLSSLASHRLPGNETILRCFGMVFAEHQRVARSGGGDGFERSAARAALKTLLIEVVRIIRAGHFQEGVEDREASAPPLVRSIIAAVRNELEEANVVERLAPQLGQSSALLHREFVRHLGISVAEFRGRERIRQARLQLRDSDASITEIALSLGYSSSQHFATAFRQITGLTPTAFRQLHEANAPGSRVLADA